MAEIDQDLLDRMQAAVEGRMAYEDPQEPMIEEPAPEMIPPPPQAAPPGAMQTRMPATEAPAAPQMNPEFEAALQRRAEMERMGGLLKGFKNMIGAATGFKPDHGISDDMAKRGQRGVDEYQAGEKAKKEATQEEQANELAKIKIGQAEYNFANTKKTSDPSSPESKLAQDMFLANAQKTGTQVNEAQIRQISAKDLHANSKFLQNELAQMYKQKSADQKAQERADRDAATQRRHDER